jgi:hypothetical protein
MEETTADSNELRSSLNDLQRRLEGLRGYL